MQVEIPPTQASSSPQSRLQPARCFLCEDYIKGAMIRVTGQKLQVHPECLKCAKCSVGLKSRGYFFIEGKVYCEMHAKQVTRPSEPGMEAIVVYK